MHSILSSRAPPTSASPHATYTHTHEQLVTSTPKPAEKRKTHPGRCDCGLRRGIGAACGAQVGTYTSMYCSDPGQTCSPTSDERWRRRRRVCGYPGGHSKRYVRPYVPRRGFADSARRAGRGVVAFPGWFLSLPAGVRLCTEVTAGPAALSSDVRMSTARLCTSCLSLELLQLLCCRGSIAIQRSTVVGIIE